MFELVLVLLSLGCFTVADDINCDQIDLRKLFVQLNLVSKGTDDQVRNLKETVHIFNETASTDLDETNRPIDQLIFAMDTIKRDIKTINTILATDECASSPCMNNATCIDRVNGYTCNCTDGWKGTHCNQEIDECASSPCKNGATCNDYVNNYTCNCTGGRTGTHCDQEIDECASSPCKNGATCNDILDGYTCICTDGWKGITCEQATDECASSPCMNNATCIDHVNGYTCNCTDGWKGTLCNQEIDECASSPCKNGATCNNYVNSYTCNCTGGWTGTRCDQGYTCSTNPCRTGLTCFDHTDSYSCSCVAGKDCPIHIGDQVKRGRDWQWNSQDGHGLGTIINTTVPNFPGWIKVKWDFDGSSNVYRMGAQNSYDLDIVQ